MKSITYIAILFSTLAFSQTKIKRYEVNCANNTVIRERIEVKELVFVSEMLPMSYGTELTINKVVGSGTIVSPSTVTTRRPKENEREPLVILKGCRSDFPNLRIGKFVRVIDKCSD
jgi:hypothetical protein